MTHQPTFPAALQPIALAILPALRVGELSPPLQDFTVFVGLEKLTAPRRVYYSPAKLRSVIAKSSGEARVLALCLGTRHCDGFIREECLRQLVDTGSPWAAPFVVQLVGEYVVEIVHVIVMALQRGYVAGLAQFVLDNPSFMATTRRRVVSYWDCYYRGPFPSLLDYPAYIALESIHQLALAVPSGLLNVNTTV